MSDALRPDQVTARLDRLPPGRFHVRFLVLVALGAWFDYYDNFVAAALVVILPRAGVFPRAQEGDWFSLQGLFMASLPLGMFVGTIVFGLASDRLGRRFGFVLMLLLYSAASLAVGAGYYPLEAVAGPAAALTLLLVGRALAGAGIGAENVIIDSYVSEVVPRHVRGRCVALVHAIAFTAVPVVFLIARLLDPQDWWLLLVFGSLGALFSWYFRRRLPESPRWLAAVGRPEEAARALAEIEAAAASHSEVGSADRRTALPSRPGRLGRAVLQGAGLETASRSARGTYPGAGGGGAAFRELFSPRNRGMTLLMVVFHLLQTIGYYGFTHWWVKLMAAKGFGTSALTLALIASLLAPVGPLLGVWTIERWQRKWLLVGLTGGVGLVLIGFGLAVNAVLLTLLAALAIVGLNWFSAVFHAYQAELFPTTCRGTGVGFTYAWSRASMMGLYTVMPALIAASLPATFGLMAGSMFAVAAVIGVFGPLTNARLLEEGPSPVAPAPTRP
jgi:putative MFS transporter